MSIEADTYSSETTLQKEDVQLDHPYISGIKHEYGRRKLQRTTGGRFVDLIIFQSITSSYDLGQSYGNEYC